MKYLTKYCIFICFLLLSSPAMFADWGEEFSGENACPQCGSTSGCMCNHPGGTGINDDPIEMSRHVVGGDGGGNDDDGNYNENNDDGWPLEDDWWSNDEGSPGGGAYGGGASGGGASGDGESEDTEEPDSCPTEQNGGEGTNPFNLKGNVTRKVTDLRMTGSDPLHWIRYNNSIPRLLVPAFGQGAAWRHNWQYELQMRSDAEGGYFLLIHPTGIRRTFHRQADGSLATLQARYLEKARLIGERVEITTADENTLVFKPLSSPTSLADAGVYQLVTLTNKSGRETRFDYAPNGLLRYITNDAENQITLYYQAIGGIPCISRVETSDGRAIEYDYETMAAPDAEREYVTLTRTRYGDGTSAEYKYDYVSPDRAPLLVEADDPRYEGRAKHIGYRYNPTPGHGVIHQEFNSVTGKAYATLEFDSADPELRIVRYTDDRTITYRVPGATNGRPTERIDSLGRKHTWNYGNGGAGSLLEKTLADGISSKYTRDQKGKITRVARSDGLVIDVERDKAGRIAKTKDNRGHSSAYVRDTKGRILQTSKTIASNENSRPGKGGPRQNRLGASMSKTRKDSISRDAAGRLLRQNFPDGTYEEYTRNKKGNVITQRDRKGRLHHYTHAERGLVASETDPAGQTTRYGYNQHGQRTSQIDALGNITTWERDERGLATRLINPDGTARMYSHDKYGRKTGETDEIGRTASWQYDTLTRLISYTDFTGGVTRYDYTETPGGCGTCSLVSNPTRITHPDGRVDEFLYDSEGRMLMRSVAVGTAHMAVTLYAYDDADNLIRQTNPDGGVIKHTYDINKRRLSTTDALGRTTSWTYDDEGNMLSQTDAAGRTTDHAYDAGNNLIYTVTADGAETTHEYDTANRRTSTTDALGNTTRWNYNDAGELVSVIDAAGGEMRHAYDSAGRRIKTTLSDGTNQTWTYNAAGQVTESTTPDGLKVKNEYNAMGRLLSTVGASLATPSSSSTTHTTYDAAGRRTSFTDPLNRTTRYEYNARNQVTITTFPDGTQTQKEYDTAGRVTADIDALGHATRYTYTALGDMTTLTDANGSTYTFEYDAMRRKTAMIYPDATAEQWHYDIGGRLVTYSTRAGQTKTTTYNLDGKPLTETWLPSDCAPDVTCTYNEITGRLATVDNGKALLSYTYDKLGRITSETTDIRSLLLNISPHTVSYLFDVRGRKAGLIYPDGKKISYTYDAQGRMTEVYNGNKKPLTTYEYDPYGRRSKLTRDNHTVTNYTYDAANQVLAIDHLRQNNTPFAFALYEYDNMGRRISMTRENLQTDRYRYDPTSQLSGVEYGDVGASLATPSSSGTGGSSVKSDGTSILPVFESFTYDPLGNRINHTAITPEGAHETIQYQTNNLNQYTKTTSSILSDASPPTAEGADNLNTATQDLLSDSTVTRKLISSGSDSPPTANSTFAYDLNGNLTNDGTQHYRYDAQNRLIEVISATAKAVFDYDVQNRCVLRQYYTLGADGAMIPDMINSVVMTYDVAWNILLDRTLSGRQTAMYVHGARLDEILANIQTAKTYYPHCDALGSVIALSVDNGQKESEVSYAAYGSPVKAPAYHRFLYTGREWVTGVGLSDHRNRYYNPNSGRWLTPDPIGFTGGLNLYEYVNGIPTNCIDPFGLCCEEQQAMLEGATARLKTSLEIQQSYINDISSIEQTMLSDFTELKQKAAFAHIGNVGTWVSAISAVGRVAAGTVFSLKKFWAELTGGTISTITNTSTLSDMIDLNQKIQDNQYSLDLLKNALNQSNQNLSQDAQDAEFALVMLELCITLNNI
jgi:RHS repeat-associated protein